MFHATFNNISVISWWSVLLVEETLSHNVVSSTPLVAIGTDCICSYKSNYHMITTMMAPSCFLTPLLYKFTTVE